MLERIPVELGGTPEQVIGDAGKSAVADGLGGVTWENAVAVLPPVAAADVSFDNAVAKLPDAPAELQAAVEYLAVHRVASRIVKLSSNSGVDGRVYPGVVAIREDGVGLHLGDKYYSQSGWGSIFMDSWTSNSAGAGIPSSLPIPVFGSKVHDSCMGHWGTMVLTGTEANPRSKVWCTGHEMGIGSGHSNKLALAFTAASPTQRIKQLFSSSTHSNYQTHWYLRDDGNLYGAGSRAHGQLGTGEALNGVNEYTFKYINGGALTYSGGQKVTRVFSSGLSTFVEVTTDDVTYSLLAAGYNPYGELGINVTGAVPAGPNYAVLSFTQCKKSSPSLSNMESTGPFKKIISSGVHPGYVAFSLVLTADGQLFHTGLIVGVGTSRNIFTLIDTGVEDVDACGGGGAGSFVWVKSDGTVKGAGYNLNYCLGTSTLTDYSPASPASLGGFNPALKAVQVFGCPGSDYNGFFIRVDDGQVYYAGANASGSGGVGSSGDVISWTRCVLPEPIKASGVFVVGHANAYFLGESGTLYAVGNNTASGLGLPASDIQTTSTPIQVPIPIGNYPSGLWDFLNV